MKWINLHDGGPHEANFLKLDCSLVKSAFEWKPVWNIPQVMEKIVEWEVNYRKGGKLAAKQCMCAQIEEYLK